MKADDLYKAAPAAGGNVRMVVIVDRNIRLVGGDIYGELKAWKSWLMLYFRP